MAIRPPSHPSHPLYAKGGYSSGLVSWPNITDTPTTRDGYGITDVYTEAEVDALLAALELGDLTDWPANGAGVLTNDGAGALTWEAAGAGTIDGSGTAGKLTKWSDADTLTDALLSDDGTDIAASGSILFPAHDTYDIGSAAEGPHRVHAFDAFILGDTAAAFQMLSATEAVLNAAVAGGVFTFRIAGDNRATFGSSALYAVSPTGYDLGTTTASQRFRTLYLSTSVQIAGVQVLAAQGAAVANVAAGGTTDANCRTTVNAILARLRAHGIIAT